MNTWFPDGTLLFSLAQVVSGFLGLGPILDSKGSFKFTLFLSFPGCWVSFVFGFGFFGFGFGFWYGLPVGSFFFLVPSVKLSPSGGSASRASAWQSSCPVGWWGEKHSSVILFLSAVVPVICGTP